MGPGAKTSRQKPSEVAADTKKNFFAQVEPYYRNVYSKYSLLYRNPASDIPYQRPHVWPRITVEVGDPVMRAIDYGQNTAYPVPFLCAANERRAGGDWETGCAGYEEKLCRRSNLSVTLNNPPGNYPIPSEGGIHSPTVVVYRGPHDGYERLPQWCHLPVISVPPTRWPKLKDGTTYSFTEERDLMRQKIRSALSICLHNRYTRLVIGDFGLGNGHRNPPQELAEMWRDLFLYDPIMGCQFEHVVFVFEDPAQSTSRLILEEMARQDRKRMERRKSGGKSMGGVARDIGEMGRHLPSDYDIFKEVLEQATRLSDPRYSLQMITSI